MTLKVTWPITGTVRIFSNLSQAEVNRQITYLSKINDGQLALIVDVF